MAETINEIDVYWGTAHLYHAATGTLNGSELTLNHPSVKARMNEHQWDEIVDKKFKLEVNGKKEAHQAARGRANQGAVAGGQRGPAPVVTPEFVEKMTLLSHKGTVKLKK